MRVGMHEMHALRVYRFFRDNDRGSLKLVLLFEAGNHPTLQWYVNFCGYNLL